jgi:hypothetical protein
MADAAVVGVALAVIFLLARHRLQGTPWNLDFFSAAAGIGPLLGATLAAAVKIWTFWALLAAIGASVLLKLDSEIALFDAILGGASGAWMAAYVLGQLLGPVGLFRAPVIWLLMIAAAGWSVFGPNRATVSKISAGQAIAVLALALAMVGLVPLELGSPAAPYLDVLSVPAAVQRIISFGRYLPYDNGPYGCWSPSAWTPGLELFLAMLGMGSREPLALLAHSASIVPMAALMIFGTYRLGVATIDDASGGIAALMLFFTNTFRRLVGVRGTAVDLALVAIALAFILDRRSRRVIFALGCLLLGTAVASHAIDGGLAIAAAALAILVRDAYRPRVLLMKAVCLFGSVLVAAPDFAIANQTVLPYPILPLIQIAGIAAIVLGSRALPQPAESIAENPWLTKWRDALLVGIFAAALIYTASTAQDAVFSQVIQQFPALSAFAAIGLLAIAVLPAEEGIDSTAIVIALLMTIIVEAVARRLAAMPGSGAFHAGVADLHYKLDEYWTPYFMVFPAAMPFAILFRRGRGGIVVAAALAILVYPWNPRPGANYDYEEHSVAEDWGIDLGIAARGYWGATPDPRWTMGPNEIALVALLNQEREDGRITTDTHILHLAQDAVVWHEFNRFSVFTGINDDPIVYDIPSADVGWLAGGRVRQMSALPGALAARPPYVLAQVAPPPGVQFPPDGYDLIFDRGRMRLYRRHDLAAQR